MPSALPGPLQWCCHGRKSFRACEGSTIVYERVYERDGLVHTRFRTSIPFGGTAPSRRASPTPSTPHGTRAKAECMGRVECGRLAICTAVAAGR
mmetsp:Transcript_18604/g.55546  ORF Transcript_18604/g.55546 Transcript_18604/m.55546 type:complete len:94 (-) Transcript_18604:1643-1924(-)|eukprot:350464-Chlamydomonas_euryale.AAC.4